MKIKRTLAIALAVCMALLLVPTAAFAATANVSYVDRIWNGSTVVPVTRSVNATRITYSSNDWVDLSNGWYYVQGSVEMGKEVTIRINGDVKLILCDGSRLVVKKGVYINKGAKLSIYGQENDSGKLEASHSSGGHPGIGGRADNVGGSLYIYGGTITAKGDTNAAGIGGGNHKSGYNEIRIYGGTVNATGGSSGAGIGRGQQNSNADCGRIAIFGGTVNAQGGNSAAGIGGGEDCSGGTIDFYGGNVKARGGSDGAGIGGGTDGDGGTISFMGGNIDALGGNEGAGVGGGNKGNGGVISVYGGYVSCEGGSAAAAMGGGSGSAVFGGSGGAAGTIRIYDGRVYAFGGELGAGIGTGKMGKRSGSSITIYGGDVEATGGDGAAGIGGGNDSCAETITISGGHVKVRAGCQGKANRYGSAIGSGADEDFLGTINITGGDIDADGRGAGAGIGAGEGNSFNGTVNISGGTIWAYGQQGAGIGAGSSGHVKADGRINISGGRVWAVARKKGAAGIGGGQNGNMDGVITISGGETDAWCENGTGAGIGAGCENDVGGGGEVGGSVNISGGRVYAHTDCGSACAIGYGNKGDKVGVISIYSGARVSSGASEGSMQVMQASNRRSGCFNQYCRIVPCDHSGSACAQLPNPEEGHSFNCSACGASGRMAHNYEENSPNCSDCGYTDPDLANRTRYIDRYGESQTLSGAYRLMDSDLGTEWTGGWYVLASDVSIYGRIVLLDDAYFILGDGYTLEVLNGIDVGSHSLTVYGQTAGTGKIAATNPQSGFAGIGGVGGYVEINGGTIEAKGGPYAPGIGGNYNMRELLSGVSVTINGGTVTATAGGQSSGIGGAYDENVGLITINGGTVTAIGTTQGAGIGASGGRGVMEGVIINGGSVTATGGNGGAGIGGGDATKNVSVTINGGTVTATGGLRAAGIGGGAESSGTVLISGGNITAHAPSEEGCGIGGGKSGSMSVVLTYESSDSGLRIAADSYDRCTLTLEKSFRTEDNSAVFEAGQTPDLAALASSVIVPASAASAPSQTGTVLGGGALTFAVGAVCLLVGIAGGFAIGRVGKKNKEETDEVSEETK